MSLTTEAAPEGAPLRIDVIDTPLGGTIGMTHCPGRNGRDGTGRQWKRDLETDLRAIEAWGGGLVVSLIESHEFIKLGVPELDRASARRGFLWRHVPIPDMQIPGEASLVRWREVEPLVLDALARGDKVLFHCAAGLGRTGTIVAKLLVGLGLKADRAIARVRASRPGAIETAAQEAFVRDGRPFLSVIGPNSAT